MFRKSVIIGAALLGVAFVVGIGTSQDTKKEKDKIKGKIPTGWTKLLSLSNAQKDKLLTISVDYQTKIHALKKQMDELKDQEKSEQFKVLTKEQQETVLKKISGDKKSADKVPDEKPKKDK